MKNELWQKVVYKIILEVCRDYNCYCTDEEEDRKGLALAITKALAEADNNIL